MNSPEAKTDSKDSGLYGASYEPCYLIRRLDQIAVSIFHDLNKHLKLTPTQFAALGAISDFPGHDQRAIARLIAVDRTTINGVTKRLSAAGLVVREKDGRNINLTLTAEGRALRESVTENDVAHAELLLKPLDQKEREDFLILMRKLVDGNNDASRAPMGKPKPKK